MKILVVFDHPRRDSFCTASGSEASYRKRGYDQAMHTQLVTGIMEYCGIAQSELRLLYDIMDGAEIRHDRIAAARQLGVAYFA